MFMAADIVVKAVMIGLAFASVLTWTIWFAKAIELMVARRRLRAAIEALERAQILERGRPPAGARRRRGADRAPPTPNCSFRPTR